MCRSHNPLLVDKGSATEDRYSATIWIWSGQGNLPTNLALYSILTANDSVNPPIFQWITIGYQPVLAANCNDDICLVIGPQTSVLPWAHCWNIFGRCLNSKMLLQMWRPKIFQQWVSHISIKQLTQHQQDQSLWLTKFAVHLDQIRGGAWFG